MIELIKNKQLIQNQLFINNEWLDAESGNTFRVKNPFDQSELTEVSDCGLLIPRLQLKLLPTLLDCGKYSLPENDQQYFENGLIL